MTRVSRRRLMAAALPVLVIVSHPPATGAAPPGGAETAALDPESTALRPGFLPADLLFTPLIADPIWPHFSLTYRSYFDERDLDDVIAGSIGESIAFYRWRWREKHLWEVGVQALVFSTFEADSRDLLTSDYFVGGALGWRSGRLSGVARVFHQSSHLGDELIRRGTVRRVRLSYEGLDAKLSADLPGGFRLYGGAGYLFRREPESLDPWSMQLGLEFRSAWQAWQVLQPVAAADVQSRGENDWRPALSLRVGVQLTGVQALGRKLQLLAEYYIGDSRDGQFFTREVQYFGAGLHFGF